MTRQANRPNSIAAEWGKIFFGDRRRYPRAEIDRVVLLEANLNIAFRGTVAGLSPFGVKVRLHAEDPGLSAGTLARLHCPLFDGEALLSVEVLVWRVDPDGLVVVFVGLRPEIFSRLRALVDAHSGAAD